MDPRTGDSFALDSARDLDRARAVLEGGGELVEVDEGEIERLRGLTEDVRRAELADRRRISYRELEKRLGGNRRR